jgi:hypothetical protein
VERSSLAGEGSSEWFGRFALYMYVVSDDQDTKYPVNW